MKQINLFPNSDTRHKPRNQYEAIVYFMANLDIEMVSSFLDEHKTYQNFPKYIFIHKLMEAFSSFQKAGDKILSIHKGKCSGCSRGCAGFTFLGNQGHFMDILFLLDGTTIKDMYECDDFENDNLIPNKLHRVSIDEAESLFTDFDDEEDDDECNEDENEFW